VAYFLIRPKSHISNIRHDGILSFRNFIIKVKNSRFTILSLFWPTAMIRPKSQNFKIGHDGILSVGNFILMIKNHILIFKCPVTDQQPKNVLPISVVTRNFLFIQDLFSVFQKKSSTNFRNFKTYGCEILKQQSTSIQNFSS
jgi:hypothetical protein